MAATQKATGVQTPTPPSLADSLNKRAPEPTNFSTLGLNRQTGVVNDPYRVGNMPGTHLARAFSRAGGQLTQARMAGWIPFTADQVTKNEYDTDKAFIADFDVDNDFVVVGYAAEAMVMCYANKTVEERGRKRLNDRWNTQLSSRTAPREQPGYMSKDDKGYAGGFTTDAGNQVIAGYEESTVNINPDNPTADLFQQPEGGL